MSGGRSASPAAILIALAFNCAHMRAQSGRQAVTVPRLRVCALFCANAALAVWFFRNWVHLLALEEGESASVNPDVIWMVIAVLIPLVLAATGWRLWGKSE